MHVIDNKLYLSQEDCEMGKLGQTVFPFSFEMWTHPDNNLDFPEPLKIEGVDHWEADALRTFISGRKG